MVMSTYSPEAPEDDNEITNPGQAPDDELFLKLKRWFISARDHSQEWRKQAEEDYAFVAGDQWSMEDKSVLKDQLRPTIVFNRTGAVIDSVCGLEIQNRQEIRYLPRQLGQVRVNEIFTAGAKWFRDQSFAEDEESDAFRDCVICGMGWTDTRLDYERDPEGTSVDERTDPLEMYWDPTAKKKNLEDRRYQFRARTLSLEDAKAMFPQYEHDWGKLHAAWADNQPEGDNPHDALMAKFYKNDQSGREAGDPLVKVLIVEAQWWDKESYRKVADPQKNKLVDLDEYRFNALAAKAEKAKVKFQSAKMVRKVYKKAFIGAEILETGPIAESPRSKEKLNHFTCNPLTGKRDRNKNDYYGLVRVMKDPQRWANKFFSSLIHQFSTSGKGVVIETDAVENVRQFEEQWARADGIKWARPGSMAANKIMQLNGAQMNTGTVQMMEYAIGSMRDVTGVNIELMGQAEKDQPGILEYQRKQAGLTILADFFDSLRRFRKTQGHILLFYIQHFFSDGRLIKIDAEDGPQQYMRLIRDPSVEEYDVIVDDAPTSPNQKEHTWLLITQLMPVLRGVLDPTVWAELLKYSPLPSSLTEKLAQYAQQKSAQPPQMDPKDQAKLQIEAVRAQADIESKRAGAIANLAKAGINGPSAQEQLMQQAVDALVEAGHSAQDHQQQMVQAQQAHQHAIQQGAQQAQHDQIAAAQQGALQAQQQQMQHQQQMVQNQQQADLAPPPQNAQ